MKNQCVIVTGTIRDATALQSKHHPDGARHETDGDTHAWIELDPEYANLLDMGSVSKEQGNLVFEVVCDYTEIMTNEKAIEACGTYKDSTELYKPGARVTIKGTLVQDLNHEQWNEIHPVSRLDTVPEGER